MYGYGRWFLQGMLFVALVVSGNWCSAGVISYSNPFNDYGTVQNQTICGHGICGAAQAINSFLFLKNYYPAIYGGTNIDVGNRNNATDASVDFAVNGWTLNNINYTGYYGRTGTNEQDYLDTKMDWLNGFAPQKSKFDAMWAGRTVAGRNGAPTWQFLVNEIMHHEDIEMFIYDDSGAGHVISLTGIRYDDTMTCEVENNCTINFQDPNFPNTNYLVDVMLTGGVLSFIDPSTFSGKTVTITAAFSESPIPLPSTVLLLCAGLFLLVSITKSAPMVGYGSQRKRITAAPLQFTPAHSS